MKYNISFFAILMACLLWSCQSETASNTTADTAPTINTSPTGKATINAGKSNALKVNKLFDEKAGTTNTILITKHDAPFTETLPSGTTIAVPPNAFVDVDGQPVTTPVEISFTEINSPSDIIASGIPMKVMGQNGETEWMQTAGMFEIYGTTNGQPVNIANDKQLDVAYASEVEGAYDTWFFDEANGNWVNNGAAEVVGDAPVNLSKRQAEIKRLTKLTANAPVAPSALNQDNKLVFSDLDLSKTPSLKGETEVVLSYAGTDTKMAPSKNRWITKPNIWHKKVLTPTDKEGIYTLQLLGNKSYTIPVQLALTDAEMTRLKADHEKNLAIFNKNKARLTELEQNAMQQNEFKRMMQVRFFGVHNYDILWKSPESVQLVADFDMPGITAKDKDLMTVYFITQDEKVVVALRRNSWGKFRYIPSEDNKFVALLPGKQAAIFTQSDFKRQEKQIKSAENENFVFNLTPVEETVDDPEALEGLIAMARE